MANRFLVGVASAWGASNTAIWSATSGGAPGASAPSATDDVFADTNTPAGTLSSINGAACKSLTIDKVGLTVSLGAALAMTGAITLTNGTLADNGYSVGALSYADANSSALTRSGSWELSGSGTVWSKGAGTTIADTGTTKLTNATTTAKTFAGGGKAYGTVWFVSPTTFKITGANSYALFKADPGAIIQTTAGTTQTAASYSIDGREATGADAPCAFLDGVAGSYMGTPDSAANRITGDIDIRVRAAVSWSSGVSTTLVGKNMSNSGNNRAYLLQVHSSGKLMFYGSSDGSSYADSAVFSTVATGFASGDSRWVRVTKNTTTGALNFYTSSDGTNNPLEVSWTQLGTTVAGAIYNFFGGSTASLQVGAWNFGGAGDPSAGKFLRVHVLNGINGTVAADFNPSLWTTGSGNTFTAATGEVWTRNGNAQFTATNLTTIMGVTNAAFTLAKSGGGVVACRDLSIRNATASPASTFYAGARSYDGGNNTNWTFNNAPATATLSATDADSTAAVVAVSIAAAADVRDQAATAVAAGTVSIAAALTASDSQELLSVGTVQIGAALSAVDGDDDLAAMVAVQIGADLAHTDGADIQAASAYVWRLINDARYLRPVISNRNVGPVKGIQL